MDKSSIGNRMKRYEHSAKHFLINRVPTIIRLDGKSFHTFTKGLSKPYDYDLHEAMVNTAMWLVANIQGAKFAYTQSDEISILLTDWQTVKTDAWFNYNVQKVVSVAASMATAHFNSIFTHPSTDALALFDARVFQLPAHDVTNYFLWRQIDATRNSIQMLGQSLFSHKHLQGKSCANIQDMLMLTHNINWNDMDVWCKRGSCVVVNMDNTYPDRVTIDDTPPIFSKDRNYIDRYLK